MHILITGGTGFIGQHLIKHWLHRGHQISVLTRNPVFAKTKLGLPKVKFLKNLPENNPSNIEVVVNLAGAPIFNNRWTDSTKEALLNSRVETTRVLVNWMINCSFPPSIFLSASAIGYYGTQHENSMDKLDESAAASSEFQSQLCQQWEAASLPLLEHGIRRAVFRLGIIFSPQGGLLPKMMLPFKLYVGGKTGSGLQKISWVHIDDVIGAFTIALKSPQYNSTYNLTAPNPVTNTDISKMFAEILQRPNAIPMPEKLLYILLGERADLLAKGQHVVPTGLMKLGFTFRYKYAYRAIENCLMKSRS